MNPGEKIRLKLTIQYDGSRFHGWQLQPDVRTVQGEIEAAVRRLTGARRPVVGSGRTDTGVHALGQVASVDVPSRWTAAEFRRAMNAVLPEEIWLQHVVPVGSDFHPRYDAVERTYLYRIGLDDRTFSPFHRPWCWALAEPLDREALERCAAYLGGERSFRAFARSGQPQRGEICHVHAAAWSPWEDLGLVFRITANRYLHHMVRYLVGTMVDVARGRRPEEDMARLLDPDDSSRTTSPPAPPEGLFLARVHYPSGAERDDPAFAPASPDTSRASQRA